MYVCVFQDAELEGELDWDSQQEGVVLGGLSYGYCATQLLGGFLAERYGGKWVYGLCTGVGAALGVLMPLAAESSVSMAAVLRTVQGALQGCTLPALYSLVAKWIPKPEKGQLFTLMFAGTFANVYTVRKRKSQPPCILGLFFGLTISPSFSGLISFYVGWQYVYYVSGATGIAWLILWSVLVYDTPEDHPRISEAKYILKPAVIFPAILCSV